MPRDTLQKKLERVRPPRVHLAYDVIAGGAVEQRELPFVIGVLGDFSGPTEKRTRWKERAFFTVDWDNFDDIMASIGPRARFTVPSSAAGGELAVDLTFGSIDDFEAERVAQRIEPLRALRASASADDRETLRRTLDRVLHAPEFQALESAWRGLWYLVSRTETSSQLKIKVIDVSKQELLRDLQRAPDVDQSALFKKVYEEPYGDVSGDPFALFIGDFSFTTTAEDMELLSAIANVASVCLAPFIAAAGPEQFGIESFATLSQLRDPSRVFDSTQHVRWKSFRDSEDARYVGLTLPRMLLRSPYGSRPGLPDEFPHEEDTHGGRYLVWGNSAYAFGTCVATAFARYGWCGAIRGVEGGGLVEGLPTSVQELDGDTPTRSCMEVLITDRREKELADLGFIPLIQSAGADWAVFFSVQSCAKPRLYDDYTANTNSRLACQLPYVLTSSRFMHYLKAIARDRRGFADTRGDWERLLNAWIAQYVLVDDQASPSIRATYPLREARIDVSERPDKAGVYRAVAFLRPHFQLDGLSVSLRLAVDLT